MIALFCQPFFIFFWQKIVSNCFSLLSFLDSDVSAVSSVAWLSQGAVHSSGAVRDRPQSLRRSLVPHRLCVTLPSWICCSSVRWMHTHSDTLQYTNTLSTHFQSKQVPEVALYHSAFYNYTFNKHVYLKQGQSLWTSFLLKGIIVSGFC